MQLCSGSNDLSVSSWLSLVFSFFTHHSFFSNRLEPFISNSEKAWIQWESMDFCEANNFIVHSRSHSTRGDLASFLLAMPWSRCFSCHSLLILSPFWSRLQMLAGWLGKIETRSLQVVWSLFILNWMLVPNSFQKLTWYVLLSIFLIMSRVWWTNFFLLTLSSLCCWRISWKIFKGTLSKSSGIS